MRSASTHRQQVERQLIAIVAADIAGYSRLMGADEEGTLAQLKACRRELIEPGIARHRGRIVKTTGDGILIEFSSPVEAVRCSVELQQGMAERNADVLDDKRIRFRVGINLGDVIVDDKDLYGDAVNIAARLESLAEPGGICISRAVHDQIRDRLALPFADGGEQDVRNIARPVGVYALSAEAVAALPKPEMRTTFPGTRTSVARPYVAAGALASLLIIAGGLWWLWSSQETSSATVAAMPFSTAALSAPRLSIVVLPFNNLSNDPEQQYFADGVTEDLTTDLSQLSGTLVISRNTAFTYKGKPINAKQIGRELAVRYVLEGSVQRSGSRVRITAQLIDADTDAHLWAERFERDTTDLFALQNEITSRIATALNLALVGIEAARPTANPGALDYIFRARAAQDKPASREKYAEAITLFEQALALDPQSVEAQSRLAIQLTARVLDQMTDTVAADIARAEQLVQNALTSSPRTYIPHFAKGQLLRLQRRCAEAIAEYEMVLGYNRNAGSALSHIASCKMHLGLMEEPISLLEQAIRLSPRDPDIYAFYERLGRAHLLLLRTDQAIVWFEKSRGVADPAYPFVHSYLAAAYGLKGETDYAAAELAEARRLGGAGFMSSIARLRANTPYETPAGRALNEATYFAGLRKAGVPEE